MTRNIIREFFKYCFVCGFAFAADFGVLIICRELLFHDVAYGVYLSVLLGFAAGHVTNYILSLLFVFRSPEEQQRGWTWNAFLLFTLVGGMGAAITEFGMWIGYGLMHGNYAVVKIFVAGIVVIWNYVGRKLIVS